MGRPVALILAFVLSGGVPLLEGLAAEPDHRCHCRHPPGEVCSCSRCRRAAAEARRARLAEAAPCHRGAAGGAQSNEEQAPVGPTMHGCCGVPERGTATAITDPFVPSPPAGPGPRAPRPAPPGARLDLPHDVPSTPPTPPPRLA